MGDFSTTTALRTYPWEPPGEWLEYEFTGLQYMLLESRLIGNSVFYQGICKHILHAETSFEYSETVCNCCVTLDTCVGIYVDYRAYAQAR